MCLKVGIKLKKKKSHHEQLHALTPHVCVSVWMDQGAKKKKHARLSMCPPVRNPPTASGRANLRPPPSVPCVCVYVCVFVCTATLEVAPHVAVGSGEQAALPAGVGATQGGHQRQRRRPAAAQRPHRPQRPGLHLLQPRR